MMCLAQLDAHHLQRLLEFFSFEYTFALHALIVSIVVGAMCGVVGTFLVLRGMSLIGDATGHATLPGVCLGFVVAGGTKASAPLLIGALVSGFAATALVGVLSRGKRSRPDAAIGIVLSVFFGLGIVLLSFIQNSPSGAQAGLNRFLYGNAAGVTATDVWILSGTASLLIASIVGAWRPLSVSIFDPTFARSIGVNVDRVSYALLGALAVAVVLSIQAVGVVLVSAMLIIPPSTALFLSKRLTVVTALSAILGIFSGALGAVVSYVFEGVATGPAMVLVAGAGFGLALLFGPRGGIVATSRQRRRAARRAVHG